MIKILLSLTIALWCGTSLSLSLYTLEIPQHDHHATDANIQLNATNCTPKHLLDVMLQNPMAVLTYITNVATEFNLESSFMALSLDALKKRIEEFEQRMPIFLLSECTTSYCELTRETAPEYRATYEYEVAHILAHKMQTLKRPVEYVTFASGGLFQDLLIVARALRAQPDGSVHMHCIDHIYNIYTDFYQAVEYAHCTDFSPQKLFTYAFTDKQEESIGAYIRKKTGNTFKDVSDKEIFNNIYRYAIARQYEHNQMLNFLKNIYPSAHIQLSAYENLDEYNRCISVHNGLHADIITSADIQSDDECFLTGAVDNFISLAEQALERNPDVRVVLLGLDEEGPEILIN